MIVAIMGLVVSLVACLNPVGFSPEVKLSIDANVSGELDVYNSNNAVSWVINKTKSVDISSVRIEVIGPSLDGAPARMDILGAPKAGASHASYHKPSKDKTAQPYQYEFTIDTVVVGNPDDFPGLKLVPGERKSFSLKKFMPRAQDYAVFLIRKVDGSLEFVDEEPPMSALDDNDLTNPPVPPGPATGR
jgi:hypothetical protein